MKFKTLLMIALMAFGLVLATGAAFLWTPAPRFDVKAAIAAAGAYDARIIRDRFGAPHIYGKRDADVAFGLAYAHAEDDWKTIEEVILFSRGKLAGRTGKNGAITDYLIAALKVHNDIDAQYETALSPQTRALLDGYAAGINLWCAEKRGRCAQGTAPVSPKDVVAGFVARTPFFYGLDETLTGLFRSAPETQAAAEQAREAFLHLSPSMEVGSNAMAVAPSRSADGHTRLMVNSHQPYTGPVAWYEARLKSEEGWDIVGGLFPGSPVILHGAGPKLGWAHTVNKPDLADVYALEVDDPKRPTKYRFDGGWRDFERGSVTLRVKLFGPFSLPVKRPLFHSVHGPAFVTPGGVFAVSYAGAGDIRSVEQWYRMDKATDFDSWRAAMAMEALPSLNAIYADASGMIAYFYNAAIPVRSSDQDWSKVADGARADLVWRGTLPLGSAPYIVAPASGYVVNSNHSPFNASGDGDNPNPADYPPNYGIDQRTTNRGLRTQALYGGDASITGEEFVAYKMDNAYAPNSRLVRLVKALLADKEAANDPALKEALEVLSAWDDHAAKESRGAPLAIRTGRLALGPLFNGEHAETPDPKAALRQAADDLMTTFGRLDPPWSETMRLERGAVDLAVDGGPDVLRAVYPSDASADGVWAAAGGDSYILYADWAPDGSQAIKTIHQFGSATLDQTSEHYADQAPLFAAEQWKTPPMSLDAVLAEATADYRPGQK